MLLLIKDVAKEATEALGALGKVWSETRLNSRVAMTLRRHATFSGASYKARRTVIQFQHSVVTRREDVPS